MHFKINKFNAGESKVVGENEDYDIIVKGNRLDTLVDCNTNYKLMKLDLEGYEYEALLGATELLKNKKIENIIFEGDENSSATKELLTEYEYEIYFLKKTLKGPLLIPLKKAVYEQHRYEPINFLATLNKIATEKTMQNKGWQILSTKKRLH